MATPPECRIRDLAEPDIESACETLALAFAHYPIMQYFFPEDGPSLHRHLVSMFRFSCELRLAIGWPLLGIVDGNQILAAACVQGRKDKPFPPAIQKLEEHIDRQLGPEIIQRFQRYAELKEAHAIDQPHYYLTAVGVRPDCQSNGLGGRLIHRVLELSRNDPMSAGVALDTESKSNVDLYRHMGFEITAFDELDGLGVWFMHRPDDPA